MSRLSPLHLRSRAALDIDVNDPRAVAVCDGCGFWTMHDHLVEKKEYRGGSVPVGTGLWVCGVCDDVPNPYYSKMVLSPDPVPVRNARPENLSLDPEPMQFIIADYNTPIITGVNPQDDTNEGFNFLVGNNP
jgi:hypothetical protein